MIYSDSLKINFAFPGDKGGKGIKIDQGTMSMCPEPSIRIFGIEIFNFNVKSNLLCKKHRDLILEVKAS